MDARDHAKRDMSIGYGNRDFAVRAYRDNGAWHGIIVENRTPLRHGMAPAADPAACFAAAIEYVVAVVDASVALADARPT